MDNVMPFSLRVLQSDSLTSKERSELLLRPKIDFSGVFSKVEPILNLVKEKGDSGLRELTKKFDGVDITEENIVVNVSELKDDGITDEDK